MLDLLELLNPRSTKGEPTTQLVVSAYQSTTATELPTDEADFLRMYRVALKELIDEGFCRPNFDPYVDRDENTHIFLHRDDENPEIIKGFIITKSYPSEVFIEMIYIHPEFRGKGIGQVFLKPFIQGLKESYNLSLGCEIYHMNEASVGLFESLGFRSESGIYRLNQIDLILGPEDNKTFPLIDDEDDDDDD